MTEEKSMTKEEIAAARHKKYCQEPAQKNAAIHADAARWRYVRDHSIRGCQDTKTTWSWHFTPRGFAGSMEELVDMHMVREKEKKGDDYGAFYAPSSTATACTCHERDSSYVCDYCYAQGRRGHMQKGE